MKLSCEIVQDLLPLYLDEVCSAQSRQAVAGHLRECEKCRNLIENSHQIPELEISPGQPEADRAVARSFKKIHRRWVLSLIAVLLIIPVTLLGVLGYNQINGNGVCYSNFNEVITAARFVSALTSGNYGKAAGLLDFSRSYEDVQDALARQPEDFAPRFVEVTIGDEKWMAEEIFAKNRLQDTTDAMQLWAGFAYNGVSGVLIPEAVWSEIIGYEPENYQKNDDGTELLNGYRYRRLETAWGVFALLENTCDAIEEFGMAEAVFSPIILLLPAEAYQAVEPEVEVLAEEIWQDVQFRYAHASAMDPAVYTQYMQGKYAALLEDLAQEGYEIGKKGFQSVYRADERWVVVYAVEVSCGAASEVVYLDLECSGSEIKTVGIHYHDSGNPELARFMEAILMIS